MLFNGKENVIFWFYCNRSRSIYYFLLASVVGCFTLFPIFHTHLFVGHWVRLQDTRVFAASDVHTWETTYNAIVKGWKTDVQVKQYYTKEGICLKPIYTCGKELWKLWSKEYQQVTTGLLFMGKSKCLFKSNSRLTCL